MGCGEAVSRRLAGESLFPIPHSDGCGSGGCRKGERKGEGSLAGMADHEALTGENGLHNLLGHCSY